MVWWESSPEMKSEDQRVLFPNGVHTSTNHLNQQNYLASRELAAICEPFEAMVAHTGFEPVLPP